MRIRREGPGLKWRNTPRPPPTFIDETHYHTPQVGAREDFNIEGDMATVRRVFEEAMAEANEIVRKIYIIYSELFTKRFDKSIQLLHN